MPNIEIKSAIKNLSWDKVKELAVSLADGRLIAEKDKKLTTKREARSYYEKQWYRCASFVFGEQWFELSKVQGKLYTPPAPSWRVRLTINLIFPILRIIMGKILKTRWDLICIPRTREKEDLAGAKVGSKILKYALQQVKFTVLRLRILFLVLVYSHCYVKTFWNLDKGGVFEIPETLGDGSPALDENGEPIVKKIQLGDIDMDICSPFEIFTDDSQIDDIQKSRYVYQVRAYPVEFVKQRYKVDVKAEAGVFVSPVEQQIRNILGEHTSVTHEGYVLLKEYWHKPDVEHKNGLHLIWAGGAKIHKTDWTEKDGDYPFTRFMWFPSFINIYPKSIVQDLIPLNKEYNKSRSQIIEHKNLMSRGKYLIPSDCSISRSAFTSEPGEKIIYDARFGHKPEQLDIKPLPRYVWENIAQVRNEMYDIAGIHEVSQAKIPSGIRSGLAISYLQEQDDSQLGTTNTLLMDSMSGLGHQILSLYQKNSIEKRIIKITGRNLTSEVFNFINSDLHGNTDVSVEVGQSMPYSQVARQNFILELWKSGLFDTNNPETKTKVLKMLEFSSPDDVFGDEALDEANANIENMQMDKIPDDNVMPQPTMYDNHNIHIKIHINAMKDPDFKSKEEIVQKAYEEHLSKHQQIRESEIQRQMAMMIQQQQAMGGGKKTP